MILTRNAFFLILFALLVLPLPIYKAIWLITTRETTGEMYFEGHGNLGSVLGISSYPVIRFQLGRDTIFFNGNVNIPLKTGEKVSIRYQQSNPTDAKLNNFSCIWGDTLAYDFAPFLIFLVIFFHPDLLPKKSKVLLGGKSMMQIVHS
jgi:hypothetical protein